MAAVVSTTVLTGCQSNPASGKPDAGSDGKSEVKPVTKVVDPAEVSFSPAAGAKQVRLDKTVKITVAKGTLSSVTVSTRAGKKVSGAISANAQSWTSKAKLAPNTTYNVSVQTAAADGTKTTKASTFTTLKPTSTASAELAPSGGSVVGVGMPIRATFSRAVSSKNRDEVEAGLTVKTAKNVTGAWRWITPKEAQWRPQKYWPANTKVKVTANLAGVELQKGVWGTSQRTANFSIGSAMISTVDISGHTMTVTRNGKKIRTIPVTTGKPGMTTRSGIKVIMTHERKHRMRSSTVGYAEESAEGYNLLVSYAMRVTGTGEFLHQAEWSVRSQGRANVSHGCTGMNPSNAAWLFKNSKVGDVVIYKNSSRKLEPGNGYTAWNMSFAKWKSS